MPFIELGYELRKIHFLMELPKEKLIENLAAKVINLSNDSSQEIDRNSWMVLHEYHHGVMPSEYDIREIDEDLYLAILKRAKELRSITQRN